MEFFLFNWFSYAFKGKSIESKFKSVESKLNSIEITWNPEFKIMIQNYSRSYPSKPFFLESLSNVWGWSPPRTNQDLTDSAMGTLPSGHPSQLRLFWKGTNTQQSLFHEWYLYFTYLYIMYWYVLGKYLVVIDILMIDSMNPIYSSPQQKTPKK